MKVKTSELQGPALDWAVAKCEGIEVVRWTDGALVEPSGLYFSPSTDWSYGGVVIQREDISFRKYHNEKSDAHGKYYARICQESGTLVAWHKTTDYQMTGPTPLIAAMRCYVASKLGDEIELPEELK